MRENTPITVDQFIRSKRKTLALIVKPDGSVVVRAPMRASMKSVEEFVQKNAEWIRKKKAELRSVVHPKPKQYVQGEKFLYLGNAYSLEIVSGQKSPLVLEKNFRIAETHHKKAPALFERWYREQARQVLNERVIFHARQHGLQYKKIGITSARTRWGSCSATGSLNFSWRLIMAPLEVVDYVVVHELVHTVYHNHSQQFWQKVESLMPDYKARRKWLRKNGHQLMV